MKSVTTNDDLKLLPNFGRFTTIAGLFLIILGAIGIFIPQLMSLEVSILSASLLLMGGIFWVIHPFKTHTKEWSEWLKPTLLLVSGGLMLFYPMTGIATIGLLLAIYLLMDAYGSFLMAYNLRHKKGWGWMGFNGFISLLLASLFLSGWPIHHYG